MIRVNNEDGKNENGVILMIKVMVMVLMIMTGESGGFGGGCDGSDG
jgi:hypothetical protein